MENQDLFTKKADKYAAARPSYPNELADTMYDEFHLTVESVIADIGCGTGKFAELLLRRGNHVIGVEPDDAMRAKSVDKLSALYSTTDPSGAGHLFSSGADSVGAASQLTANADSSAACSLFSAIKGSAEHTGLPEHRIDAVTAAQAFHWFDTEAFRQECCRILRPDGLVFLVWNLRDPDAPVTREVADLYARFSPRFHGFNNGFTEKDPRIPAFFPNGFKRYRFDNPLSYDRDTFISRCESSSHAPQPGTPELDDYRRQAGDIFDRLATDGVLPMANYTLLLAGDPRPE